ncbi:hypothetical protein ACG7TL_007653 [Trametes sanguinea]
MATNILQAKHTYMDHVLITLVNLHCIYNTDNIKLDVKDQMLSHLELQWKKGAGEDQIKSILCISSLYSALIQN